MDISSYSLAKSVNMSRGAIEKYRNGQLDIMNMKLSNALKIQTFYNNKKGEIEMENKVKTIRELATDIEKGMNGASIYIWENKQKYFENLRTNNDPNVDWEDVMEDELGRYGKNKMLVECNRGDGIPKFFNIDTPLDIIKSYFR